MNDTTYTFTMPDGKVTIAATFGCDGGDNCPSKAFIDLGDKQWYHDFIDYAVENGLLEGTSPTTMEPNATLIRAQLAQILYNIEDKPAVTGEMVFEDVPPASGSTARFCGQSERDHQRHQPHHLRAPGGYLPPGFGPHAVPLRRQARCHR